MSPLLAEGEMGQQGPDIAAIISEIVSPLEYSRSTPKCGSIGLTAETTQERLNSGHPLRQIGRIMGISHMTAKNYLA